MNMSVSRRRSQRVQPARLLVISGHLSQLSGGSNRMELKWPQAGFGVEQGADGKYKCIHEDSHSSMDFLSGNIHFGIYSWNSSEQCFSKVVVKGFFNVSDFFSTIYINAIILIILVFVIFIIFTPRRTAKIPCFLMGRCAFIILQSGSSSEFGHLIWWRFLQQLHSTCESVISWILPSFLYTLCHTLPFPPLSSPLR